MVRIKDSETTTRNWIEGSIIKGFLREGREINWAIGIIRDTNFRGEELEEIFTKIKRYSGGYVNDPRLLELENKCRGLVFL